jgi:hypothetical protein
MTRDDPSSRETSDGTLLSARQAREIADRWPGIELRECRSEITQNLSVYHPSRECPVLREPVHASESYCGQQSRFLSESARQLEAERDDALRMSSLSRLWHRLARRFSEQANQAEASVRMLEQLAVENGELAAKLQDDRDAAREDIAAHEVIVRGLTEDRDMLRERIAALESERDQLLDEVGKWRRGLLKTGDSPEVRDNDPSLIKARRKASVERERNAQRLLLLRTVARMAEQFAESMPRGDPMGCDCTVCCLRAALGQLEEGDV